MAEKARDAFRTISEVANWLDVPAHVLRFWESKFSQIKPVKRAGGRRYYRPDDMRLIGGIKQLLHDDGLTIRGVQKMLKEEGVKHVSGLSPAIDMPSEEEGAARRDARRARRQTRQSGKDSASAPPSQDITAQAADDASDAQASAQAQAPTQLSEPELPGSIDTGAEPSLFAQDAPLMQSSEPDASVGAPLAADAPSDAPDALSGNPQDAAPADPLPGRPADLATPGPATPEPATSEPAAPDLATPGPATPPPVEIPSDPALSSINASPGQKRLAAALRALRGRHETFETPPQHHATLRSVLDRLQALHDRMIADGVGS